MNSDRIRLYGWFIKPQKDMPVFLHLHGQAESILSHQDLALYCLENGYGLFMLSYRGHYKSGGTPSERGLYKDAHAAMKQLKKLGVDEDKVIIWGHSLGTVVALESAVYHKVMGVIIQSPIKDIKSAAINVYKFYCKRLHLNILANLAEKHIKKMRFIQKMDNMKKIKAVKCPILILHSKTDRIAPYANSIDLATQNPAAVVYLSNTGSHWNADWCITRVFEFAKSLEYNELIAKETSNRK